MLDGTSGGARAFARGKWRAIAGIVSLLMVAVACSSGTAGDATEAPASEGPQLEGELVVANWGGSDNEARFTAYYEPFEEETGVKIVSVDQGVQYNKVKAMVDAGRSQWDMTITSVGLFYALGKDYLKEIDYTRQPELWASVANTHPYAAPHMIFCETILYRTDAFPAGEGPATWADFWDTQRFPGARAIGADGGVPWNVFEPAQLAAGVAPDSLYPVDYDTSFSSLDKLRSSGDLEIWSSYGEAVQMLTSGRVDMVRMSTAPFFDLIQSGEVAVSWAEPICSLDSIEIVGNTEQYEAAMAFIDFQAQPKRQAEYAMLSHNGPITPEAFKYIPKDIQAALPGSPETAANIVWSDNKWYGENYDEMVERWNEWVTG